MRKLLLATVAAAGMLAAGAADAAIMVRASVSTDGGTTFTSLGTATDEGAGDALVGTAGALSASFTGLGILVTVTSAFGSPVVPYPGFSTTFNATNVGGTASRILRIEYTQTSVPALAAAGLVSDFSVTSLLSGETVSTSSYIDAANAAFGTGTLLFSNVFPASGTASGTDYFAAGGPYSETIVTDITFASSGAGPSQTALGGAQLTAVPEPATLAMLGMGLLGLAGAVRSRKAD